MGSSQDLNDTVAHYRHRIYSIIHTEKTVRSLYEESFKNSLQEAVGKPFLRSQRNECRPKCAWQCQPLSQPQMSFMAPMYKPLQLPRTTSHDVSVSTKLGARDQTAAFTSIKSGKIYLIAFI